MGLFDSYFDPEQFQDSGGLVGRLLSLEQQQGAYQPGQGFTSQSDGSRGATSSNPIISAQPASPRIPMPTPRPMVPVSDPQTPQIGPPPINGIDDNQASPDIGDRLSAGFQNWAHTPVGNPFAALANGISGLYSGQRSDATGVALSQAPGAAQSPELADRLSAGFQSWAHTPVGNPFAAIANGISGFGSGRRNDPAAVAQQIFSAPASAAGNPSQDLHAQYQALRPILGDRNAMLAVIDPRAGQTMVAQALDGSNRSGAAGNTDSTNEDQPKSADRSSQTANVRRPGTAASPGIPAAAPRSNNSAGWSRKPRRNFPRSVNNGQ